MLSSTTTVRLEHWENLFPALRLAVSMGRSLMFYVSIGRMLSRLMVLGSVMPVWTVPNKQRPGFISLFRRMPPALSNHACDWSKLCLPHWVLSLSLLTPRMLTSSYLLLLSHATLRLMTPTARRIVNNLAMILIHASMLLQCIGHFKVTLRLVCCGRR